MASLLGPVITALLLLLGLALAPARAAEAAVTLYTPPMWVRQDNGLRSAIVNVGGTLLRVRLQVIAQNGDHITESALQSLPAGVTFLATYQHTADAAMRCKFIVTGTTSKANVRATMQRYDPDVDSSDLNGVNAD